MVYVNRGEGLARPLRPDSPVILGETPDTVASDSLGLFHHIDEAHSQAVHDQMGMYFEQNPQTLPLDLYQQWATIAWKTRHGTDASVLRFGDKLDEELTELKQALNELAGNNSDQSKEHVTQELGDVLWVATAAATNAGATMDGAIKARAYEYVMGIRVIDGPDSRPPRWHAAGVAAATSFGPVTIQHIRAVIDNGFDNYPSPVMNVYGEDDNPGFDDVYMDLFVKAHLLHRTAADQYGIDPNTGEARGDLIMHSAFDIAARQTINPLLADIVLLTALIAHRATGGSLTDIVTENVRKVSGRAKQGLVDKADGARPDELK